MTWFSTSSGAELGIDLGTANTLVALAGRGIVFDQPSVCCFQAYDAVPRFISAGAEAHRVVGKVSRPLKIVRPLRNGVLSDMASARELLTHVKRAVAPRFRMRRPRTVIGIPADATQAERRALRTAAVDAGFAEPALLPEPLLAAIGCGLDVDAPRGRMIVDCGAGTTEVAVISLGGICLSHSVRGGGDALDQSFLDHLHFRHRFHIGGPAAEGLKIALSRILSGADDRSRIAVKGLDAASGLPRTLELPVDDLLRVWTRHHEQILEAVREALAATPPELCRDIMEDGIVLCGGGALAGDLARRLGESSGIATRVVDRPLTAVAEGLARMVDSR